MKITLNRYRDDSRFGRTFYEVLRQKTSNFTWYVGYEYSPGIDMPNVISVTLEGIIHDPSVAMPFTDRKRKSSSKLAEKERAMLKPDGWKLATDIK